MENITEESGRLASLAVFRELYDSKEDVYGVLACFLAEIIIAEAKHSFTLHEIARSLNETFNFNIPEAVVKTSLRRLDFLEKKGGVYIADLSNVKSLSLIPKREEISKNNDLIIRQVIKFIEGQKENKITEIEEEKIIHSFCSFLLNKSSGQEYSEYISAFIIKNQQNPDFTNKLKCIKEGVVLYTGIMFNENVSDVGSWRTELIIFLDTEILFDCAGFNGELYKSLFDEFYSFVKEINYKAKKPLIKLKYFTNVGKEIERFFKAAELILEGGGTLDPGKPAMIYILNGCKSRSDVIEKKATFFNSLSVNGILEDDYDDYYNKDNHEYNILDESVIKKIGESIDEESINDNLEFLNFINILRKNYNNSFENIKYIFLTANLATLQASWHSDIRPSGKVPLAVDLAFLTDKFWFKLNKGFGRSSFPKVFDIITKAQILLSTKLKKSVGSKFDELQKRFRDGSLSKEEASSAITELRRQFKKPEDIKSDDVASVLSTIKENDIDKLFQEQELFRLKAKKNEEKNQDLKNELEKQQSEYWKSEKKYTKGTTKLKRELLLEKKENLSILKESKNKIDKKTENYILILYKIMPILLVISYIVIIFLFIRKYGWNIMEPWTYIFAFIPPVAFLWFSFYQEETFNLKLWIINKMKRHRSTKYKRNNFDIERFNRLSIEIGKIEQEISES